MPEGDTLHQAATRLEPLVGRRAVRVAGSHRVVIARGRRLAGHTVSSVVARGKHLLIGFDHGWSLRTHLAMTGSWQLYRSGERWRISPGKARVIIETNDVVAVCFAAPTVQIGPNTDIHTALDHLGPDLIHDEVDWGHVVQRARTSNMATAADLLLDQTVMAGIGNVYKSETLYLERLHPMTVVHLLDDVTIQRCGERAQRLLLANRDRPQRTTTGRHGRDATTWVYGRAGKPCRRCGDMIVIDGRRADERLTYWCPTCQPA